MSRLANTQAKHATDTTPFSRLLCYPAASTSPCCYRGGIPCSGNSTARERPWNGSRDLHVVSCIAHTTRRGNTLPTKLLCLAIFKPSVLDQQPARIDNTSHDAEHNLQPRSLPLRPYSQGATATHSSRIASIGNPRLCALGIGSACWPGMR
ncbi:hypothetical protein LZ30DRAFT_294048 [Colletotrichum cereale]|nr:hypothetical protein LZ30DRAFT_294048 [Colletotrichum cereale]